MCLIAILSSVAASFFLLLVFPGAQPTAIAAVAVLWGTIVLAIDRLLVATIERLDGPGLGRFVRGVVPRLLLATLISFVVATPLELRLFEPEARREAVKTRETLKKEVLETQNEQLRLCDSGCVARFQALPNSRLVRDTVRSLARSKRAKVNDRRRCRKQIADLNDEIKKEIEGRGGAVLRGCGSVCKGLKNQRDELKPACDQLDKVVEALRDEIVKTWRTRAENELEACKAERDEVIAEYAVRLKQYDEPPSFLDLHGGLWHWAVTENNWALLWIVALMALVWCIETIPVLMSFGATTPCYSHLVRRSALLHRDEWESVEAAEKRVRDGIRAVRDEARPILSAKLMRLLNAWARNLPVPARFARHLRRYFDDFWRRVFPLGWRARPLADQSVASRLLMPITCFIALASGCVLLWWFGYPPVDGAELVAQVIAAIIGVLVTMILSEPPPRPRLSRRRTP